MGDLLRPFRERPLKPPLVTMALIGVVLAVAVELGVFRHELPLTIAFRYGYSGRGLLSGNWQSVLTSQLLTRDAFMATSIAVSLLIMVGPYELLAGTRRTLVVVVTSMLAGPLVVTAVLAFGSGRNISFASQALSTLDYGASAITAGGGGALVAVLDNRRLRLGAVTFVLGGLVLHHQLADWQHLVAFPVGYALGRLQGLPATTRAPDSPDLTPARHRRGGLVAAGACALLLGVAAAPFTPPTHPASARSAVAVAITGAGPTIVDRRYPTPSLGGDRRVLIMLPAGYDPKSTLRYPVIELLHGRPGSPNDLLTSIDLPAMSRSLPPFIAVVPDGHGPVVRDGDFADTSHQRLGAALSDDLRAWVDATYRTNGNWSATGVSAGGYGAAYLASRQPGQYQAVCSLGGYFHALDPAFRGESSTTRDAASPILHPSQKGPRTLIIAGNHDPQAVSEGTAYQAALVAAGQPSQLQVVNGDHQWNVWQREMPRCLAFILTSGQTR
jgi:enterochelin esterase-like enzyme